WCRRQPALALACAVAVAGLLAVTVVSVLFAWSETRGRARLNEAANDLRHALVDAREHKRLAEENYRKAHQAIVDFYVRSGYDRVEQVGDGWEPVQKELLETALKHFQDFLKQKEGDPTLRAEVALTCGRIGHMTDRLRSHGEALTWYDRAMELFEQLAKEEPQNTHVRICTARVYLNRGVTLGALARAPEAIRSYQK